MYNVLRINKVEITQDQVFAILQHLPRKRNGKIKLDEFLNLPIISEDAFKAIDRNKDGFLRESFIYLIRHDKSLTIVQIQTSFYPDVSRLEFFTGFQVVKATRKPPTILWSPDFCRGEYNEPFP